MQDAYQTCIEPGCDARITINSTGRTSPRCSTHRKRHRRRCKRVYAEDAKARARGDAPEREPKECEEPSCKALIPVHWGAGTAPRRCELHRRSHERERKAEQEKRRRKTGVRASRARTRDPLRETLPRPKVNGTRVHEPAAMQAGAQRAEAKPKVRTNGKANGQVRNKGRILPIRAQKGNGAKKVKQEVKDERALKLRRSLLAVERRREERELREATMFYDLE